MLKICTRCKQSKTLNAFHNDKNGKYGKNSYCKVCRSEKRKEKRYPRLKTGDRKCPSCKEIKNVEHFASDSSSRTGLQTYCKSCQSKKIAQWTSTFDGYMTKTYKDLQNNAKRRNISVNISKQNIIDLYKKQNGKCALTGETLTHICEPSDRRVNKKHIHNISVDRINSRNPYTVDNIQLVCNRINAIKWDLDQDEFIELCKKVVTYNANISPI